MKRHYVSFLLAVIFIVAAFIAKYNIIKEGLTQSGEWFKVILANGYWILFIGGAVFALLGSREFDEYEKKKRIEKGRKDQ